MRLFIAITLTAFQETNERDNKFMNSHLSDHFREVWSKFDPNVSSHTLICYFKYRRQVSSKLRVIAGFWSPWETP